MNILFKKLLQEGPMFKWSPLSDSSIKYMSFNVPPSLPWTRQKSISGYRMKKKWKNVLMPL